MFKSLVFLHVAVVALVASSDEPGSIPQYFAVDIDGTFFTVDEHVLNRNIDAFRKARDAGHTLFFCTGRAYAPNASHITPLFALSTGYNGCPGVYCNGAIVLDQDCNTLYKVAFSKETIATILKFIEKNGYQSFCMFSDGLRHYTLGDTFYFSDDPIKRGRIYNVEKRSASELLTIDILKIHLANWIDTNQINQLVQGIDCIIKPSASTSVLSPPQVTKVQGVAALAKHWNIDSEEIGFIGDGLNDIEMMRQSNYSYAVGNALPEVKQHAKFVIETPYDQGAFAEAMSLVYNVSAD